MTAKIQIIKLAESVLLILMTSSAGIPILKWPISLNNRIFIDKMSEIDLKSPSSQRRSHKTQN